MQKRICIEWLGRQYSLFIINSIEPTLIQFMFSMTKFNNFIEILNRTKVIL